MESTLNILKKLSVFSPMLLLSVAASSQDELAVELDLRGSIEPRCEVSNMTPANIDFSRSDSGTVNFDVYCNLEMSIGITSRNGALLNEDAIAGNGVSASYSREYSVRLSLDAFDFTREAEGRELIAGVSFDVTEGIVYQTVGALDINLHEPLAGGYAGDYTDEIRISVSPSLSHAISP